MARRAQRNRPPRRNDEALVNVQGLRVSATGERRSQVATTISRTQPRLPPIDGDPVCPGLVVGVVAVWLRRDDFVGYRSENVIDVAMFDVAAGAVCRRDAIEPKDAPGLA